MAGGGEKTKQKGRQKARIERYRRVREGQRAGALKKKKKKKGEIE